MGMILNRNDQGKKQEIKEIPTNNNLLKRDGKEKIRNSIIRRKQKKLILIKIMRK